MEHRRLIGLLGFPILGCSSARVEKCGCSGPDRCRPKRAPQKTRRVAACALRIELMALECVPAVEGSVPEPVEIARVFPEFVTEWSNGDPKHLSSYERRPEPSQSLIVEAGACASALVMPWCCDEESDVDTDDMMPAGSESFSQSNSEERVQLTRNRLARSHFRCIGAEPGEKRTVVS